MQLNNKQYQNIAYDITGPEALSYSQVAGIISKEIGKEISYMETSEGEARKGTKVTGLEDGYIDAMMEFYVNAKKKYGKFPIC